MSERAKRSKRRRRKLASAEPAKSAKRAEPAKKSAASKRSVSRRSTVSGRGTAKKAARKVSQAHPASGKKSAKAKRLAKAKRAARPVPKLSSFEHKAGPEYVAKSRTVKVRGYWDRYPSSAQRKHPKDFKFIKRERRRGATAFDKLYRDYQSFTPAERKKLTVRVAAGVAPDTGRAISKYRIKKDALSLALVADRAKALDAISRLLVRSGVIDTPRSWGLNRKRSEQHKKHDDATTLTIEWVLEGERSKSHKRRAAKKSRAQKSTRKTSVSHSRARKAGVARKGARSAPRKKMASARRSTRKKRT